MILRGLIPADVCVCTVKLTNASLSIHVQLYRPALHVCARVTRRAVIDVKEDKQKLASAVVS